LARATSVTPRPASATAAGTTAATATAAGRPGRKRDGRCDAAIIEATAALLAEVGYDGLTMDAVAQRAGVAKTTLYRRWPAKPPLVADVLTIRAETRLSTPDTGDLRADLAAHLRAVRDGFATPNGRAVLGVLAAANRLPELATVVRERFVTARRAAIGRLLATAAERGQARADVDADLVIDLLVGPLYYRLLVSGQAVPDGFVDGVVDAVLPLTR
jgi:AcrR family transcriptional regulator